MRNFLVYYSRLQKVFLCVCLCVYALRKISFQAVCCFLSLFIHVCKCLMHLSLRLLPPWVCFFFFPLEALIAWDVKVCRKCYSTKLHYHTPWYSHYPSEINTRGRSFRWDPSTSFTFPSFQQAVSVLCCGCHLWLLLVICFSLSRTLDLAE